MSERRGALLPRVRCHQHDLERWQAQARAAGWSFSRWVRAALDMASDKPQLLERFESAREPDNPGA